jgi:asparagine synthase (glutamine-hydrolysing)
MKSSEKVKYYQPKFMLVCFKKTNSNKLSSINIPELDTETENEVYIRLKSYNLYLRHSKNSKIYKGTDNQLIILLNGQILNYKNNELDHIAKQYRKLSNNFIKDINGSFNIIIIDKLKDEINIYTDRINSRKVFYSDNDDNCIFSSQIYYQPVQQSQLDVHGLACYIANGAIFNNRTLFEGINILERGTCTTLGTKGISKQAYWEFYFTNEFADKKESILMNQLSELMIESIKTRVSDESGVFLSLSAGYDSAAILGILGEILKVPDVRCFSYAYGNITEDSDEYIAKQMAGLYNYEHKIINSYNQNLDTTIERNAILGQGLSHFCDEIDSWFNISGQLSENANNILFVGDQNYGYTIGNILTSFEEVINILRICNFSGMSWLKNRIPGNIFKKFKEALNEEINIILKRCSNISDNDDLKDYLYLDQRLNHVILPWRDFIIGNFIQVENPHLDNNILDFVMKIPTACRINEVLYVKTITKMFPKLFSIKRAERSSYVPNWKKEFSNISESNILFKPDSRLESYFPVELIKYIYNTNKSDKFQNMEYQKNLTNKIRDKYKITNFIINKLSIPVFQHTNPVKLLIRLYVIKMFLHKTGTIKLKNTAIKFNTIL